MASNILELRELVYERGGKRILSHIDWTIRSGEHWALLGANGSGKTSLLQIIAGYAWPQDGSVRVMGELYGEADIPELRKRIGWVTSSLKRQVLGHLPALSIVLGGFDGAFGVFRAFSDEEKDAAREALRSVGCEHLADRAYDVLSQGERQRILLARGLVHRPALLILDEPCSGLDPVATRRFLADLRAWAMREGAPTVVYVTHHLEEIAPFLNRTLVLREGSILASGETDRVLRDEVLSDAFGCACRVAKCSEVYSIEWMGETRV
jgi:iron complex transport system ATP-binding protein